MAMVMLSGVSRRRRVAALLVAWLGVAGLSALFLVNVQKDSRKELEERFRLRTELTADFVQNYSEDFLNQERLAAERTLGGKNPTNDAFQLVVTSFDSEAAVMLDSAGRAIGVAPYEKDVLGADLGGEYAHLKSAVGGTPAVSNVVPSAAQGIPIVAFATPFQTNDGARRVFSAAFDIRSTPLANYLSRAAALKPNSAYLVDAEGVVLATNTPDAIVDGKLPDELASFGSTTEDGADTEAGNFVVSKPVDGTPWQLVMVTPDTTLFAAISGKSKVAPWLVWLGFADGGLFSVWLASRLIKRREALTELNLELDIQANRDPLTKLANRRRVETEIEREIASARRHEDLLSVLLVDIDSFKSINDEHGHRAGDEVLCAVSRGLGETLRETDLLGRWGGDEFLVTLPRIDGESARQVAERLNERIRSTPVVRGERLIEVTVSIGCAEWSGDDAETLVHRADEALYAAKTGGRDRAALAPAAEVA